MICRKVLFLAGLTLCASQFCVSQTVISANHGQWDNPLTWEGGVVPSRNSSLVIIRHDVDLGGEVEVCSLEVSGKLSVLSTATLKLLAAGGTTSLLNIVSPGRIDVTGRIVGRDSISYSTTPDNLFFYAGSFFQLDDGPRSFIPIASWDSASTLLITGFRNNGYVALLYSNGWRQEFGRVIYNCPAQSTIVDLNGHLRRTKSDFIVQNTNGQALRLSTSQRSIIDVKGNFVVDGRSEVWLATSADSTQLNIGGHFFYNSTSTGPSYFATRGKSRVNVSGDFVLNTSGAIRFCSGSTDSVGIRRTTLLVGRDFLCRRGAMFAPAPGRGILIFRGKQPQTLLASSTALSGAFDLHVLKESTLDLGQSVFAGSGNLNVAGTLILGSNHPMGALQNSPSGNVINSGRRFFSPGAILQYQSVSPQFIGAGHPRDSSVSLQIVNTSSVTILQDLLLKDLEVMKGRVVTGGRTITASGDVVVGDSASISSDTEMVLNGRGTQSIRANTELATLSVQKLEGSLVFLNDTLRIGDRVTIAHSFNTIVSNGKLVLLSKSRTATASVAVIPAHSSIVGDVTVQRFLPPGRMYRYLSSPLSNAKVDQLMDDFPVTGLFTDPSTGKGISSRMPSLFYFDDNVSEGESGWSPYPAAGLASENTLHPGRGYAAFIRNSRSATVLDLTGTLNQGTVRLPVQFTTGTRSELRGWNLVGNPYASSIDWASNTGWERSRDISAVFAVRDNEQGRFLYHDGEVGDLPDGVIASGQSFWIRTSAPDPFLNVTENAKSSSDTQFFRKKEGVNHLVVTVEGEHVTDRAYLRVKDGASADVDRHDATKMKNDLVTLAIVSSDSLRLAISAVPRINCTSEIPLSLQVNDDILPITLSLNVSLEEMFGNCRYRLLDRHLNVVSDSSYSFEVNQGNSEAIGNRFALLLQCDSSLKAQASRVLPYSCRDTAIVIQFEDASPYSIYGAEVNRHTVSVSPMERRRLTLPVRDLHDGLNEIVLTEKSICYTHRIDTITVNKERVPDGPVLRSATRCPMGEVFLRLQPTHEGAFRWSFPRNPERPVLVTTDSVFIDNAMAELYRVEVISDSGCNSDSMSIKPVDYSGPELEIVLLDGVLCANLSPVQWYRNGVNIPDSTQCFRPAEAGIYTSTTIGTECRVRSNSIEVGQIADKVSIWPVPVTGALQVTSSERQNPITEWTILSCDGRSIRSGKANATSITIDTSCLGHGVYLLRIIRDRDEVYRKFVK
jgi:hypothetical protein